MSTQYSHHDVLTFNKTTPDITPGSKIDTDFNGSACTFRMVKVVDIACIAGDVMVLASSTAWDVTVDRAGGSAIETSGNVQKAVGVMVGTVAINSYGYMLIEGIHSAVSTDGGVAIGESLVAHSVNGEADTMADGEEEQVFATALTADTATNFVPAHIYNCS